MPVPLVGRSAELKEIARAWHMAPSTRPCTVVITGEPGIGKSRLVSAVVADLAPHAATVLSGAARPHSPAPYDWLASILSRCPGRELSIPADALAWLAQDSLVPAQRYAPGALLRLACRAVHELVGKGPALLVVEDLHALDPASLSLIAELARDPTLPAMLLVTSLPTEVEVTWPMGQVSQPRARDGLVARTLACLSGSPGAVRQHLGPLGPAEVAEIVPAGLADDLLARSKGNPYHLSELLAALPSALCALTAREQQVLSFLAAGMSNKQMARSMGISIRTVAVHVSNVLRKTGNASRTAAAVWAAARLMGSGVDTPG